MNDLYTDVQDLYLEFNVLQGKDATNEQLYARGRILDYIDSLKKKLKKAQKKERHHGTCGDCKYFNGNPPWNSSKAVYCGYYNATMPACKDTNYCAFWEKKDE